MVSALNFDVALISPPPGAARLDDEGVLPGVFGACTTPAMLMLAGAAVLPAARVSIALVSARRLEAGAATLAPRYDPCTDRCGLEQSAFRRRSLASDATTNPS